ncbi:MAG: M23 family metallopeptidase [Aquificae bacterium]|nr:M23 family metallopeptidase [Aquificota bacterium]
MRKALLLSSLLFSLLSFPSSYYRWDITPDPNIFEFEEELDAELNVTIQPKSVYDEMIKNVKTPQDARPSIWPVVGVVTSHFGWRRIGRYKEFHAGIDIAAPTGTPVVATADGVVLFSGYVRGYGYVVVIYHGYGFTTLYAHLSGREVRTGEHVAKGKVIGYVGATGRTTGSHLHYEVIKYGIRQNPILYLP